MLVPPLLSYLKSFREYHLAVDGLALAGKGTLGQSIENVLQWVVFNTGDFFRAVTYYLLSNQLLGRLETASESEVQQLLSGLEIGVLGTELDKQVVIQAPEYQQQVSIFDLKSPEIDASVSAVAGVMAVRAFVDRATHAAFRLAQKAMIEARDSYDVSPDVDLGLYLEAQNDVLQQRAIDRWVAARGEAAVSEVERTQIAQKVLERNRLDQVRLLGKGKLLTPQEARQESYYGAVIDTSELTPREVFMVTIGLIAADRSNNENDGLRNLIANLLLSPFEPHIYQSRGVQNQGS